MQKRRISLILDRGSWCRPKFNLSGKSISYVVGFLMGKIRWKSPKEVAYGIYIKLAIQICAFMGGSLRFCECNL